MIDDPIFPKKKVPIPFPLRVMNSHMYPIPELVKKNGANNNMVFPQMRANHETIPKRIHKSKSKSIQREEKNKLFKVLSHRQLVVIQRNSLQDHVIINANPIYQMQQEVITKKKIYFN